MRVHKREIPEYLQCGNVKYYYAKMNGYNLKKANTPVEANSVSQINSIKLKEEKNETTSKNIIEKKPYNFLSILSGNFFLLFFRWLAVTCGCKETQIYKSTKVRAKPSKSKR